MSAVPDPAITEQAIAWHLRLKDADEDAWIEFAEWLEADPARNAAYEAVADGDAWMAAALPEAAFPPPEALERSPQGGNTADHDRGEVAAPPAHEDDRKRYWRWGALAASVAVTGLLAIQMMPQRDALYSIETRAGQTRTVPLADGSEIVINGDTRIVLDRNDARLAKLARGEARFVVKHDASDPFTVIAGKHRLVDLGTVFNVVRTDRQVRVGVAEGAVRFEGISQTVELRAGDSLSADTSGKIAVSQHPAASIGSWADGVLVYDRAPLGQIAEDLSRSIGVSLDLPGNLHSTPFSGVIQTDGEKDAVRNRLEELIGHRIVADGTHWSVEPR